MKKIKRFLIIVIILFGLLQFIQPTIEKQPQKKLLSNVPDVVENSIRNSCYDCHSYQPDLKWFDRITPANFLVASHIKNGRMAFDFSKYDSLNADQKSAALFYALNRVTLGEMPLSSYTMLHPAAKMNANDVAIIENYLKTILPRKTWDSTTLSAANKKYENTKQHAGKSLQEKKALNGIGYIPNYRSWKAISTTDRFDNGTMRIIYANETGVKAIQEGNTNTWPDGTIFAKAAWWQQSEKDGIISMGQFKQVEFMIKDSKKYAATGGWGWARFLGDELKPYGKNAMFVTECVSCHKPLKEQDYVFTNPLSLKLFDKTRTK
ncbi:MAG: cytochrome P460 family protein [Chitinophagaceae bacterium]